MKPNNNGPSDDAWGVDLVDPLMVTHGTRLILFARAKSSVVGTLYFRVLDPSAAAEGDDLSAWNGWYRYDFPGVAPASTPQNARDAANAPPAEHRLAGMDLLTVPEVAGPAQPADASFRVTSDGVFLAIFRQSTAGTLLMNRVGLRSQSEQVGGSSVERFTLEPAWEVRFRRSGLRDVPLNELDQESCLDPTGGPFHEPTIEFANIKAIQSGAYGLARVPTLDPDIVMYYVAVTTTAAVQLHQIRCSVSTPDYTETPAVYPLITPTIRGAGTALAPIAGLAPALVFYAEHERASSVQGREAELQRAGHLMLTIPVAGGGLTAAVAVYDFALGSDGGIPPLPANAQSLILVDGTLSDKIFTPDADPATRFYPKSADLPASIQMVDGLLVSSMLLGQPQPKGSLALHFGDDGLVHLYFGGPPPVSPYDRWSSLDPNLPQAMVAQFDARSNRLVLSIPWSLSQAAAQPSGTVDFYALQSGGIMEGAKIAVADGALFQGGVTASDLCNVSITYPSASGLPSETWHAVPRALGPFMDVLNGKASGDSANQAVLNGGTPFYDYTGALWMARLPLSMPSGVSDGYPPAVTFVSTRPDIKLKSISVTANGDKQDYQLVFFSDAAPEIVLHWRSVPPNVVGFASLFDGAATPRLYAYPPDSDGTPLFGLITDALEIQAPVILYPLPTNTIARSLTIAVAINPTDPDKRDVTFTPGAGIDGVPADVAKFVTTLKADPRFVALGLGISGATAAGKVAATPPLSPVGPMTLAATAALFDVMTPAIDLTDATVTPTVHPVTAGTQGTPPLNLKRMAGFLAASLRPAPGATAYVGNTSASPVRATSRVLHSLADNPLVSGVWIRPRVQQQCSFGAGENLTASVTANGRAIPSSINLRPQWDWTLEAWVRPVAGNHGRLVTFLDNVTPTPTGAPALAYAIALDSNDVVQAASYAKQPGMQDSAYFQTLTSLHASFMPSGAFTWEFWIKPDDVAAPPAEGSTIPVGAVIQLRQSRFSPFLTIGLAADRRIAIATSDDRGNQHQNLSQTSVPAVDPRGQPIWSHIAVIGKQDAATKQWTIQILLDGSAFARFAGIVLQSQPGAVLVIGADTPADATVFGSIAQIRYWSIARSSADIRRTWLTTLSGAEPGLLGNWPLSAIESGGGGVKFARNTASLTSTDWDAKLSPSRHQALGPANPPDSFFLAVTATVGGLPTIKADALLANDRWNHLALVYSAGGALSMNLGAHTQGATYDWVNCGSADALGPGGRFSIDAFLRIPAGTQGQIGTIMARWANDANPDGQVFKFWIDDAGEMNLWIAVTSDNTGSFKVQKVNSIGAILKDGLTHHIAVVFNCSDANSGDKNATWHAKFYKDGIAVGGGDGEIADVPSISVRGTHGNLTIGTAFVPIPDAAPMAEEDFFYLHGLLGQVRFWGVDASIQALFPERYPRIPQADVPSGVVARWRFREQAGRTAMDPVGGNDGILTNSAMWASMAETSAMSVIANGTPIGSVSPATALEAASQAQFTLGAPLGGGGIAGFTGAIAQVALYGEARSAETIQDQMFVPRYGNEAGLLTCWNFNSAGADITGGQNDLAPAAGPPIPQARIGDSNAPLSIDGPYVRNAYLGAITDYSQSAPGQIAVGTYADAQDVATEKQRGVLKRQYVVDPVQTLTRAIQIGELDLTYLGQVQTDPTLIGYIEGAPPVPSENLTRPYYLSPASSMAYLNTATVSLVQESAEKLTFTSSSSHATKVDVQAALGVVYRKKGLTQAINLPGLPTLISNAFDVEFTAQALGQGFKEWGSSDGEGVEASWNATQRDTMGVKGDWEPHKAKLDNYLNPKIGRRFLIDNTGYALVESLAADLYALTFGPTQASVGTILLANPAIPRDRNIIVFPLNTKATKNGTLDGKIGLVSDTSYKDADVNRGSYFKPVEAYAMAASVERERQRSAAIAKQFDPARKADGWDVSLDDARKAQSQDFTQKPGDPVPLATPVHGLVNRYIWTSQGGFHAEEQRTAAASSRSYSGANAAGGGGGFHAEGEALFNWGVSGSFDVMASHRVDVQVSKEASKEQSLSLDVVVTGDSYLRTYNPDSVAGSGEFYFPDQAPGKVSSYRFMTFYLPPSISNSVNFASIVDPQWILLSNDPDALALRNLKSSARAWRVFHRVTYVQRIPPPIASRPVFTPATKVVAPVNVEGNAELIRMVDKLIPTATKERTRLVVGTAVAAALDPAPVSGIYPQSELEKTVPWWRVFLDRARSGQTPDPKALALLEALVERTITYMFDGYAAAAFDGIGVAPYISNGQPKGG